MKRVFASRAGVLGCRALLDRKAVGNAARRAVIGQKTRDG